MFDTVLVADRGVMACRVVRTCQRLGARTVTVHSEADARRLHAVCADESLLLGPADPASSYLDGLKVIEAAGQAGAQAVHPGAGPLARSAAFAAAVQDAGLTWVGAPPHVLAAIDRSVAQPPAGLAVTVLGVPGARAVAVAETVRTGGRVSSPPALDGEVRGRARTAAVEAADAAGLVGLGTVAVTTGGQATGVGAWLSIDHLAAELAIGTDLVEQQLAVAAGRGAAVGTGPIASAATALLGLRATAPGRLTRLLLPEVQGVQVHPGCREGDDLSPADGVLLVLAALGSSPDDAGDRLAAARAQLVTDGIDLEESP